MCPFTYANYCSIEWLWILHLCDEGMFESDVQCVLFPFVPSTILVSMGDQKGREESAKAHKLVIERL